ncbi:MAG: hypothetical protein H8D22_05065 [Candidatus Cloacimonetes bacterium]|nr:hypothetical protein [Candidatus Cloacimonadota bacterium]
MDLKMVLPEKDYFNVSEVAERWNCSEDKIYHYFEKRILYPSISFKDITGELWEGNEPGNEGNGRLLQERFVLNELAYVWDYNKLNRTISDDEPVINLNNAILVFEVLKPDKWFKVVPYNIGAFVFDDENFLLSREEINKFEKKYEISPEFVNNSGKSAFEVNIPASGSSSQAVSIINGKSIWKEIENEFDMTKRSFAKKINFIKDNYMRKIIFRDVEHSFWLAYTGYAKPAIILAGGVIEELLRMYISSKGLKPSQTTFDSYIKTCENNNLLKKGISQLSDSVRHFRNLVHLENEGGKKYRISKATSKGAVSSIFTLINNF